MANKLFASRKNIFVWKDVKTFLIRSQYNEVLKLVLEEYGKQYTLTPNVLTPNTPVSNKVFPNFLNEKLCLTIQACTSCRSTVDIAYNPQVNAVKSNNTDPSSTLLTQFLKADNDCQNAQAEFDIMERTAKFNKTDENNALLKEAATHLKNAKKLRETAEDAYQNALKAFELDFENAQTNLERAKKNYEFDKNTTHEIKLREAESTYRAKKMATEAASKIVMPPPAEENCQDLETDYFCMPKFYYERRRSLADIPKNAESKPIIDLDFNTKGLTVGALIWLYYYERMGVFKILGALMDDYNYRGKYTISGNRTDGKDVSTAVKYSNLMDMICALYRTGMSSNQRDRICSYQRVLGVSIENNLGIDSEKNAGFMQTFSKLIEYMLEYYKAKQLASAINTGNQARSSVATQTSIRDTVNLLQQQFEPMQYGRNQINTFLGIATVHMTLCLVNMLRKEIGIPDQYEKPEEFIPAAYDILVAKPTRPQTLNETNRFILFDNCASYGYRLLTDIETLNINEFTTGGVGGTLNAWVDDVEGLVEGYRNAYASVPEGVEAIL